MEIGGGGLASAACSLRDGHASRPRRSALGFASTPTESRRTGERSDSQEPGEQTSRPHLLSRRPSPEHWSKGQVAKNLSDARPKRWYARRVGAVDVVVVAFNSRQHLRACVGGLAGLEGVRLIVVDNASADGSLESIADLPVERLAMSTNGGFARACNVGWQEGTAPLVLFLNPDTSLAWALTALAATLEADPGIGAAGPKIVNADGALEFSQRRFPASAIHLSPGASPAPPVSSRHLVGRGHTRRAALRACRDRRLAVGRVPSRPAFRAGGGWRLRRGVLPLLRGHRSVSPPPERGLRRPFVPRRPSASTRVVRLRHAQACCRSSLQAASAMRRSTVASLEPSWNGQAWVSPR